MSELQRPDSLPLIVQRLQSELEVLQRSFNNLNDDSGWIVPPLLNSWKALEGRTVPAYRRIGNRVWLRGQFALPSGVTASVAFTIPTELAPSLAIELGGTSYTASGNVGGVLTFIDQLGNVEIYYTGSPSQLSIDGLSFMLD